jgi:HAD superfamily hydrolase (TIGR01509 family)
MVVGANIRGERDRCAREACGGGPPDAVVFDFDGVLVDSEPLHYRAFSDVLKPLGMSFTWAEYVERFIGFDDRDTFREAFARAGRALDADALRRLVHRKAEAFAREVRSGGAAPYPGAAALIDGLRPAVPLALCSGALRRDIDPILESLGLSDAFLAIVTADDVHASKPDPASYRLALERLSAVAGRRLRPGRCVAIEDTPTGIRAARGAGLRAMGVATTHRPDALREADRVVRSLADVRPEDLALLLHETA